MRLNAAVSMAMRCLRATQNDKLPGDQPSDMSPKIV
jgi:hypothetical protein